MAYYDALITEWATLTGTTAQKLATINSMTVAGPNVDVEVSQIVGSLLLSGAYVPFSAFSSSNATGNTVHDTALNAAKTLMAAITVPNAPTLQMSNSAVYATIAGMGEAVVALETANPGLTGFTQTILNNLLALSATTQPWWKANGYTSPFNNNDLIAAGGLN